MFDVAVVGAGPAGSTAAMEAARRGLKVALLEEHREVGRPLHCAGILHRASFERTGLKIPDRLVDSWIARLCIYTGLKEPLTEPFRLGLLVVDRAGFDEWLCSLAVEAGAELKLAHRVVDGRREGSAWRLRVAGGQGLVEAFYCRGGIVLVESGDCLGNPQHYRKAVPVNAKLGEQVALIKVLAVLGEIFV